MRRLRLLARVPAVRRAVLAPVWAEWKLQKETHMVDPGRILRHSAIRYRFLATYTLAAIACPAEAARLFRDAMERFPERPERSIDGV